MKLQELLKLTETVSDDAVFKKAQKLAAKSFKYDMEYLRKINKKYDKLKKLKKQNVAPQTDETPEDEGTEYYVTLKVTKPAGKITDDDYEDLDATAEMSGFRMDSWGGAKVTFKNDDSVDAANLKQLLKDLGRAYKGWTFTVIEPK